MSLIGAGILVLVLPSDKPFRRTESPHVTRSLIRFEPSDFGRGEESRWIKPEHVCRETSHLENGFLVDP